MSLPSPLVVSIYEEMNPSRRSSMEDCSVYHPPGSWDSPDNDIAYLGVYDGHGGRDMVEYLEHGLSHHVAQELKCQDDSSILVRLERAFLMADIHSNQLGVSMSGATVAVCLVKKEISENRVRFYTANVGDTRIVLGHKGKAIRLTQDHRTDDPDEIERIEKAGGFMFKGRVLGVLAVTRSLGDHCMKEYVIAQPFVRELSIDLDDKPLFLILGCDGLWDVMSDQQAVDICLKYQQDKLDLSKYLVDEAIRRGTTDNVTVVVAWL